jgi:hypothetical protein
VLSNGSHYFSQLFNQDSVRTHQAPSKFKLVSLQTITRLEIDEDGSECLEIMLRYLYTGTWEPVKPETLDDFDEYMEKIVAGS